jgi:hypothetical protein
LLLDVLEAGDEGLVDVLGGLGLLLLQVVDAVEDVLQGHGHSAFLERQGQQAFSLVGGVDHCCCNIIDGA